MSDGMDMEDVRKELMKQTERIYVDVLKERVEVMNLRDLERCAELLARALESVSSYF